MQPTLEVLASYAALGLMVGFGYYASMAWNAALARANAPEWWATALGVLRLAAAIAFFAWLASIGAVPVLSAFVGFLVGRMVAFRLAGEDG
jgi:predicted anti-sigma-YlaC factor YlaD